MPDAKSDSKEKEEREKKIAMELKEGTAKLEASKKAQIASLHEQAVQEKALHSLLVDQQVKHQELVLSQQYNQQLMLLTQAAQRQGAELEQQATNLMLDYHQRKVEEDFVASQEGVEKQFAEMQHKFADELARVSVYPPPPSSLVPPLLAPGLPPLVSPHPPMLPKAPMPTLPYVPPPLVTVPSSGSFAAPPASGSYAAPPAPVLFNPFNAPGVVAPVAPAPRPSSFATAAPMMAKAVPTQRMAMPTMSRPASMKGSFMAARR